MSRAASYRLSSAFGVAALYVVVGALRWSEPLHAGGWVALQGLFTVLVYGNLLALLVEALALALRPFTRREGPRTWLPVGLIAFAVATGELAVRSNLELPPLIGLGDSLRLVLLAKAAAGGAAAVLVVGIVPWWLMRRGAKTGASRGSGTLGRNLVWIQAVLVALVLGVSHARLGTEAASDSPNAPLAPLPGRGLALVCVDAAYWEIVDELIDEGRLPSFAALRERGAWGHLITYGKRLSPIVWTTLVTGVKVEKHGVAGWTEPSADGSRTVVVPSTSRNAAALWNVADAAGLSSLVLNWLITAPPETIEGAVIPDLDRVFLGSTPATHPAPLAEAVMQEYQAAGYVHGDPAAEPLQLVDLVGRVYQMATELRDYDLVVLGTQATDHVQHRYFLHRYPELFDDAVWDKDPDQMRRFRDLIARTYEQVDELLGLLLADGRPIVVVSDHGARAQTEAQAVFNFNALFEDMGVARCLPHESGKRTGKHDPGASVVFAVGNDAYHNDLAFFAQDPPAPGIAAADLDAVFAELRGLRVAETDDLFFREVVDLRGDSTPGGHRRHKKRGAIGVAVMASVRRQSPRARSALVGGKSHPLSDYVVVRQNINGSHSPRGVFLFSGGDFPAAGAIDKVCLDTSFSELLRYLVGTVPALDPLVAAARLAGIMDPYTTLDIMPTLLSYLGLPIARDMDGGIMGAVLRGTEHARVARASYADLIAATRANAAAPQSDEENERVLEQLRALGYVN